MNQPCDIVEGAIDRILFSNEETGHRVLRVRPGGSRSPVLVSGRAASAYPGQFLHATREHHSPTAAESTGDIFHADRIELAAPATTSGFKKFLKSTPFGELGRGLIGVLCVEYPLPAEFFSDLSEHPENLLNLNGIGKKRQQKILEAWRAFSETRETNAFFFAEGLPLLWAARLRKSGLGLKDFLDHPYRAVKELAFEFDRVDPFALKRGWRSDSSERIVGAIHDVLHEALQRGHCALPEELLLRHTENKTRVSPEAIESALETEALSESLIADRIRGIPCIYLADVWKTEREVKRRLLAFENKEPPWGWFNLGQVVDWAQNILNIQLAPMQKNAIDAALSSSLTVITGGPGTGKTTLIRSLVTILQTRNLSFALCTPTGRAAQRLQEATGFPAKTVHRLLKYNSAVDRFIHNRDNPLPFDVVLIDEVSMVDLLLISHLLEALPPHCALILVGDSDQIPSVGAGSVLQSIIDSDRFTIVRLTDIFRQSAQSLIKLNAQRINAGKMPLMSARPDCDFQYVPVRSGQSAKEKLRELVDRLGSRAGEAGDPSALQILVPKNSGPLGAVELNEELQRSLNPSARNEGIGVFRSGDKVMVTQNNYTKDVFNGDIGFVRSIDHDLEFVTVRFARGDVTFDFDELEQLTLAYAITIHKSQGSEYRSVIIVITRDHLPLAQRHLIYTAITRGKEQVYLIAEPDVLHEAIQGDETGRRWQGLTELLRAV